MQKLVWQNANGVELDLTSGNYGITEWEGFSNASLNIQSQQVPFQDGGVFLDALIEQRELSVTLAMQDNNNLELRYQQRREIISALNPKLGEGYLIYTNDYTSKRIKCVAQIPLFETHNSDTVGTPKASLSWTACEPYWEDVNETVVESGTGETYFAINNTGDIAVGFKAEIEGTSEKRVTLFSQTQNKKIEIENTEPIGNFQINTNLGQKAVSSRTLFLSQGTGYTLDNQDYEGIFSNVVFNGNYYFGFSKRTDAGTNKRYQALFRSKDFTTWEQVGNEIEASSTGAEYLGQYNGWLKIEYNRFDGTLNILCFSGNYDGQYYTDLYVSEDGGETWTIEIKEEQYFDFCLNEKTQELFFSEGICVYNPITEEIAELPSVSGTGRFYIYRQSGTIEKDYTDNNGDFQGIFVDSKGNYVLFHKSGLSQWYLFYVDCNGNLISKTSEVIDGKNYIVETNEGYYGISDVPYVTGNSYIEFSKDLITWERVQEFQNKVHIANVNNKVFAYSESGLLFTMNENNNIINLLTSDSDLNMQIEIGSNNFVITADNGDVGVKISYRQKYIGV